MNALLSRKTFDQKLFRKPTAVFRPVPFFSWNERMEPDELRRQVDLIADAGWGGAFVHSRIGLTTPYLGKEWFAAVDATIDQCRKRRIKVWLYDEDKWPSGYSGGSVPLADKAFRLQAIVARHENMDTPPDCEPIGGPRAGLRHYVWTAPLGQAWFNGTCYAGLMHRDAMKKFLEDAYQSYYKRYKEDYGNLIVGEFTDEPCSIFRLRIPHAAVPYTPELLPRFVQRWGYDPIPHLHLLYREASGSARFRLHYLRIVNELFEKNFSRQLGEWCEDHGIALTGHYMLEDHLYGQQTWGVKIMPNYRHQHIPGVDHLGRHVGNLITLKQCQSVVNQYEKPRMLSELYGVAGGSLSFEDRHWIASQQMCLGVNLLNPHLSLYTMAGCRKRDYPPNIFYQQPWWPLNEVIDAPLSRVCAALSQGRYHAEALIIHPGESSFVHWQTRLDPKKCDRMVEWDSDPATPRAKKKIEEVDSAVKKVMDALLADQRTFDLGDETILADDASVVREAGQTLFRVGKVNYPLVILPEMTTIAGSTVALLTEFVEAGGIVFRCGKKAEYLDGEKDRALHGFYRKFPSVPLNRIAGETRKANPPAVEIKGATAADKRKLFVHIRDLSGGDRLVYITNLSRRRDFNATIRFRGGFESIYCLDTETGEERKVFAPRKQRLEATLPFHRTEAHLFRLSKLNDRRKGEILTSGREAEALPLKPDDWTVNRLDDNAITLDYAYWRIGDEAFSPRPVPVIGVQQYLNSRAYDGPLTLQYPVTVDKGTAGRKVHLVLEYPERYRIRVNGRRLIYEALPAWRDFRWMPIDITGLLSEGENRVELDCPNFTHGDLTSIHDPFARYGTEIESIYLIGDFSVQGRRLPGNPVAEHWKKFELPPIGTRVFDGRSFSLTAPWELRFGDSTARGLPFYAGRLRYRCELSRLAGKGRWFVRLKNLDCPVAEVRVNGESVGSIYKHPLELEITRHAKRSGARLEIILYGSLRNLLGPHHHTNGEMAEVSPQHFAPPPCLNDSGENVWVFRSAEDEEIPYWTDNYCMVSFGDLKGVDLIRRG